MRGKAFSECGAATIDRITPAYAGKSTREENRSISAPGSPLRMRGKGSGAVAVSSVVGITPAYAGKRLYRKYRVERVQDHPCVCGEKSLIYDVEAAPTGSPLRMRGKDADCNTARGRRRITPAYAGKRAS